MNVPVNLLSGRPETLSQAGSLDGNHAPTAGAAADNMFITQYFDWNRPPSRKVQFINALLAKFGFKARLVHVQSTGEQTSIEQRINTYHLAGEVIRCQVPGDFVEIGCHRGSTAALLQKIIHLQDPSRSLHVYDAFFASSPEEVRENFRALQLQPPVIYHGLFHETLPSSLPGQIAFVHLDVGWRQPVAEQENTVFDALTGVYPRMAPGAICILADYCDPDVFERQKFKPPPVVTLSSNWSHYPAVKAACDTFFADKEEAVCMLYGGPYSHGYFRKASDVGPTTKGHTS